MAKNSVIAVVGGGNIGLAIARGLRDHGDQPSSKTIITRRSDDAIELARAEGFDATTDNGSAVERARTVLLCVQPTQAVEVLTSIKSALTNEHRVVSVVTGVKIEELARAIEDRAPVVRAMPNTAVAMGESMTCVTGEHADALAGATALFDRVGTTLEIPEELMTQATALCACGIAFFLRAIRAASQGGIEIGFHAEEALTMAAQTARGAASLLADPDRHPEGEIDRVTTPMGCTIAGLNQMEHEGFSSALIKGIVTSARKAGTLGTD